MSQHDKKSFIDLRIFITASRHRWTNFNKCNLELFFHHWKIVYELKKIYWKTSTDVYAFHFLGFDDKWCNKENVKP